MSAEMSHAIQPPLPKDWPSPMIPLSDRRWSGAPSTQAALGQHRRLASSTGTLLYRWSLEIQRALKRRLRIDLQKQSPHRLISARRAVGLDVAPWQGGSHLGRGTVLGVLYAGLHNADGIFRASASALSALVSPSALSAL